MPWFHFPAAHPTYHRSQISNALQHPVLIGLVHGHTLPSIWKLLLSFMRNQTLSIYCWCSIFLWNEFQNSAPMSFPLTPQDGIRSLFSVGPQFLECAFGTVVHNQVWFCLPGTVDNIWRHFWSVHWGDTTGIYWVEVRDIGEPSMLHRTVLYNKEISDSRY